VLNPQILVSVLLVKPPSRQRKLKEISKYPPIRGYIFSDWSLIVKIKLQEGGVRGGASRRAENRARLNFGVRTALVHKRNCWHWESHLPKAVQLQLEMQGEIALAAPKCIAALNVGAMTLHSMFGLSSAACSWEADSGT
jgi:hypothetical protein